MGTFGSDSGNVLSHMAQQFLSTQAAAFMGAQNGLNGTAPAKAGIPMLPNDIGTMTLYTVNAGGLRLPTITRVYEGASTGESMADNALDSLTTSQANVASLMQGPPANSPILKGIPIMGPPTFGQWAFTGQVGWFSANAYDIWGGNVGTHQVQETFYQFSQVSGGLTYSWALTYVQHYTTSHCPSWWEGCWAPQKTIENIVAHSDQWPGQHLWDAQPTGQGCLPNCPTISYSISTGLQGQQPTASFSDTYSFSAGETVNFNYLGDGTIGSTQWTHSISNMSPNFHDTTFSMEPSTIYLLDPTKAGSQWPLITNNHFSAWYQGCGLIWCLGSVYQAGDINFGMFIYNTAPSTHSQGSGDRTANIQINACPATDFYTRSAGLSFDKPLPTPWWTVSGYEFGQYGGCFQYNRSVSLPQGSNYIELGISGFCPSYCWSATIRVNGNVIAQGNVARDAHLRAYFTL